MLWLETAVTSCHVPSFRKIDFIVFTWAAVKFANLFYVFIKLNYASFLLCESFSYLVFESSVAFLWTYHRLSLTLSTATLGSQLQYCEYFSTFIKHGWKLLPYWKQIHLSAVLQPFFFEKFTICFNCFEFSKFFNF